MPRTYNSYRRRAPARARRPSERVIRGAHTTMPATQQAQAYVWTATDPCTVGNIRLDIGIDGSIGVDPIPYALVYVPEGYNINNLTYPAVTDDMYNPTKSVLISGVLNNAGGDDHKFSRIGRKCSIGDRIALILLNTSASSPQSVGFELSFTTLH